MKFMPHEYQRYVAKFIENHATAAVFLDMGLGRQNGHNADRH